MGIFLTIAVFGVFSMNHGSEHGQGCIAAVAQGNIDCPNKTGPFAFLIFHLDVFKSFSTATFGSPSVMESLVVLALILISFLTLFFGGATTIFSQLQVRRRKRQESFEFPLRLKLNRWLALHENSPTFS